MKRPGTRLFLLVAIWMVRGAVAHAGDPPVGEADELVKRGFQLRLQGKNTEALDLFSRAHAISPSGKTLAQIGVVEAALRRWVDAQTHLQEALARHDAWTDTPTNREMLEKTLADVRQQIARVRFAGIAGAEISIDGKRVGVLPIADPIHVAAGVVRVRATAPGRQTIEKQLVARGGEEITATLELALAAPAPLTAPPVAVATEVAPERRRSTWGGWAGAALGAAGLAAAGTGVAWLVIDGNPTCTAPPGAVCRNLYDTTTQGWVAVGLGAAATAAGAALLLWPARDASAGIGVRVSPGSLAVAGRF